MNEIFICSLPAIIDMSVCILCGAVGWLQHHFTIFFLCYSAILPLSLNCIQMVGISFHFILFLKFHFHRILMEINGISYGNSCKRTVSVLSLSWWSSWKYIWRIKCHGEKNWTPNVRAICNVHNMCVKIFKSISVQRKIGIPAWVVGNFRETQQQQMCLYARMQCWLLAEMVMSLIIWTCLYLLRVKEWMIMRCTGNSCWKYRKMDCIGKLERQQQWKWLIWQRDKSNKCFHFECARWNPAHCLFICVECNLLCINSLKFTWKV